MNKSLVKIGAIGSIFTAICCFTPALVWVLSIIGLAAAVAYLDYVLFPLLAVSIVLLVAGIVARKSTSIEKT